MNHLRRAGFAAFILIAFSLSTSVMGIGATGAGSYHNFYVDQQNHVGQIYFYFPNGQHFGTVVFQDGQHLEVRLQFLERA